MAELAAQLTDGVLGGLPIRQWVLTLPYRLRYVLRPPVAQEALELTSDGKVLLRLRQPWSDGTRAICFEPSELLRA